MFHFPAVGTGWEMPAAGRAGLAPGNSAKMTPTWMAALGKGHAGLILGKEPQDLILFPAKCDAASRSWAWSMYQERGDRQGDAGMVHGSQGGLWASLGRALTAPVLPRSTGPGGCCPKDDLAPTSCKQTESSLRGVGPAHPPQRSWTSGFKE